MTDQLAKPSAAIHPLGASIPQLQRTIYHKSDGTPRDGSPSCAESAVDMEQYYQPLERFHGSGLHGWGIAAGLHVAVSSNLIGVTVLPGIALDSNGLHILVVSGGQVDISPSNPGPNPPVSPGTLDPVAVSDAGVTVPTSGLTGEQYLVLQFGEKPLTDTPTLSTHTPWLHFIQTADLPHDGSCIPLAKVTLDGTGKVLTLTQDVRQRADKHVERAQDISIHGPGVVVGLDVTATLNSAGVTILPGVALDGNGQYLSLAGNGQAEVGPNADTQGTMPTLANVDPASGVTLATTGLSGDKYLTIQFWETPVKVGLPLPPLRDQVAPYRFVYTPWLRLVDPASVTNDPLRIILAKVTFGTGANVGLVTNLTQDVRQVINLGIGSIHLLKSTTTLSATNSEVVSTAEAGTILPFANGLALTVPNASDEIHLNAAKVVTSNALTVMGATTMNSSLTVAGATTVNNTLTVAGPITANSSLTVAGPITANSSLTVAGPITANSSLTVAGPITAHSPLTATNPIIANSSLIANGPFFANGAISASGPITANGSVGVGLSSPRTPLHVLGRISTGLDFTSAGAITFFPPDGFAWFHIDNGPAGGRSLGRLRFSFGGNPGDNEVMSIDQARNVTVTGNFSVTGQKRFVQEHPTDATKQIAYVSLEGGESGTYIRGTGTLINGKAVIELPEHFRLVTHKEGLTVQLTPRGAWLQLYVVELNTTQAVVREAQDKNGEFDYFVQGVRAGYENHDPIEAK